MTDQHQPWTDKHRPTTFDEIQGNNAAIDRLKDWADSFPSDTTPRLLVGPPGTGKTSTVEVIADWLDLQMVELNASSARKKDDVQDMASVIDSRSVDGERRVVLLDEVDSWHHSTNKQPLYDAMDDPNNIVFCTANDKWETPTALVNRCEVEKFKTGKRSRKAKIRKVAESEDLDLDSDTIDSLAERPDLRSAITDLQVFGPAIEDIPDDSRDWDDDEWDMVDKVLSGTPDTGNSAPPESLVWLDENLTVDWRGLELAWGYEALSRADRLLGKARRDGYRHWKYAGAIIESLAHLRITEPYREGTIGRGKDFPEWYRHSAPDASGGSAEAKLYRSLSEYDTGGVGITQSFARFREVVLPQLQSLDFEGRCELILTHGLQPDEYEALDVTQSQFEGWVEKEQPEEGDGLTRTEDASAW